MDTPHCNKPHLKEESVFKSRCQPTQPLLQTEKGELAQLDPPPLLLLGPDFRVCGFQVRWRHLASDRQTNTCICEALNKAARINLANSSCTTLPLPRLNASEYADRALCPESLILKYFVAAILPYISCIFCWLGQRLSWIHEFLNPQGSFGGI